MFSISGKMESFESMRTDLLDDLSRRPEEVLRATPFDGKWSILDILEHMVVAEREVLMGLPEYKDLPIFERTFKNKLMLKIVMFVLGNRIRVKVPSRTMNPKGGTSFEEIRASWDESQAWFRAYLESCDEEKLGRAVFKHPVSGPITPAQAVDMSLAHFENHRAQIERILEVTDETSFS